MMDFWRFFSPDLRELLGEEDDPAFWQVAVDRILADTHARTSAYAGNEAILVQLGRCSHWIRPHTKNRAGTAWPFGYGNIGEGLSLTSLPELEWSLRWVLQRESKAWVMVKGQPSRRPLVQRIALPARTARHPQGTVHTIWLPGSPEDPRHKLTSVYGFKKCETAWECVDHWEREHSSVFKRRSGQRPPA